MAVASSVRYPLPDPDDPFASLSDLRARASQPSSPTQNIIADEAKARRYGINPLPHNVPSLWHSVPSLHAYSAQRQPSLTQSGSTKLPSARSLTVDSLVPRGPTVQLSLTTPPSPIRVSTGSPCHIRRKIVPSLSVDRSANNHGIQQQASPIITSTQHVSTPSSSASGHTSSRHSVEGDLSSNKGSIGVNSQASSGSSYNLSISTHGETHELAFSSSRSASNIADRSSCLNAAEAIITTTNRAWDLYIAATSRLLTPSVTTAEQPCPQVLTSHCATTTASTHIRFRTIDQKPDAQMFNRARPHRRTTYDIDSWNSSETDDTLYPYYTISGANVPSPSSQDPKKLHDRWTHSSIYTDSSIHVSSSASLNSDAETLTSALQTRTANPKLEYSRHVKQAGGSSDDTKYTFKGAEFPSTKELYEASQIDVYGQDGAPVKFGTLFQDQTTIMIFVRHFWCPMDQDYMNSIATNVDPEIIRNGDRKLIVIGCGSPSMIKSYCRIFRLPYEMYTDPSLRLYSILGMTLRTLKMGPSSEKGDYIKHGLVSGSVNTLKNNVKHMPLNVLLKKGGNLGQLGGEFVLGPGLRCDYAHRMHTTRAHTPIREVISASGLCLSPIPQDHRLLAMTGEEEDQWMRERDAELREISARRYLRRWNIDMPIDVAYGLIDSNRPDLVATEERDEDSHVGLGVRSDLMDFSGCPSYTACDGDTNYDEEDDYFELDLESDDFDRFSCDGASSIGGRPPRTDE